ncbi:MAG: HD domain-containing protein [Chloroflexi bacterium]|nr:HD domain-containing protein [Chloroflexota bacterium]
MIEGKLKRLAEVFVEHGKRLYLVGGSVRDRLLGREHTDVDGATDALPQEIKSLAAEVQPEAVYTVGERFGTIGLVLDGRVVEITTFRSEHYKPYSRKPEVTFGTSLLGDLSRRDFTINAMAQDALTGEMVDPCGGSEDLKAGIIRAVGRPEERFSEDPLRLMRAVRFAAQLGLSIDEDTERAIARNSARLRTVSQERITAEMNRILLSPNAGQGLRRLTELDLMEFIVPEFLELRGTPLEEPRHKDVYEHTLAVVDKTPPELPVRWAGLLHDIAKPPTKVIEDGEVHFYGHDIVGADMARRILHRMRLDRQTIETVSKLVYLHQRANLYEPSWTDGAVRRLMRDAGDNLWDLLALSRADITSHRVRKVEYALAQLADLEERCRQMLEEQQARKIASPLDGNELMAIFQRPPGPWIREVKDYLLEKVLDGELNQDDKLKATQMADEFLQSKAA